MIEKGAGASRHYHGLVLFGWQSQQVTKKTRMTAKPSAQICLDEVAERESHGHLALAWVSGGILLTLAVAVTILRFYRLEELPPGVDLGEGANGLDAIRVLRGEHSVFFPDKLAGREGLVVYCIALAFSLLGQSEVALRLPTALASAGTVFAVFWLGRILFGRDEETGDATPWRWLAIGGVGSGLMAVSISQTIMGRIAFRTTLLPFLLCLCLAVLWQGWRRRNWWYIALAGACAGLLPYTYIPARLAPFLFALLGLTFAKPFGSLSWQKVRVELPRVGVFIAVAALIASPILIYFALHPASFMARGNEVSVFHASKSLVDALTALLANSWDHLLAFGFRGDPTWRNNYAGRPILNPIEAFFFWLGIGYAVWRWRREPACRLLLLWLGIMIIPALLARHAAPNTMRMIGAAPAVYLLIGFGLWELFSYLRRRFAHDASSKAVVAAAWAMVCVLLAVQGVDTYHTYFQKWAGSPEILKAHQVEWAVLADALNTSSSGPDEVYLLPYRLNDHYGFDFLYHGSAPAYVIRSSPPQHVRKQVESALAETETVSVVKVVDWNDHIVWSEEGSETLGAFLGKYGNLAETQEFHDFRIHTYKDIELDRSWTLYDYLEPLTVHYDGGISLHGFALGQGPDQPSSQSYLTIGKHRPWWIALQWQTAAGLEVAYSISLRLHDDEGRNVYQSDAVLENSVPTQTNGWRPDELVDTLHFLEFPSDLSPGNYKLRLVVYDFETLKPTVELGVWKPEAELAVLRVVEGR